MSLTSRGGPFSTQPAGRLNATLPRGLVYVEPFPRRVRGLVGGQVVLDSERVLLVHREDHPPAFAFPVDDVHAEAVGVPIDDVPGHVTIDYSTMDEWFEEDERVLGHPRNPYHRVDCVPTSRRLRVALGGDAIVDTSDTMGVYETGHDPKLYVSPTAVRDGVLMASATSTFCPYKGTASYWSADVGGEIVDDVAWSYDDPYPECARIAGFLCFDEAKVAVTAELPQR